ncbi:MAG: hypothetical protein FJX72_18640 [Armatimonadetes bacterium]|nr:hypothetical protein [Armatimonadota bacterium]
MAQIRPLMLQAATTMLFAVVAAAVHGQARPMLVGDYTGGRVVILSAKGEVEWETPAPGVTDVWMLPNGNVLHTYYGGVKEITRDKKVVWEYKTGEGDEVYTCQRLPNGDTMVGELKDCQLIEVSKDGTIRKVVKVPTTTSEQHMRFRNARKLANGHYLVACTGENAVKELDADGKVVWSVVAPGNAFGAVRLRNGNTLVSCGDGHQLVEMDRAGKIVWSIRENELPGIPLRFIAGVQRLPNGNTIVCNWLGHGHIGDGTHLFEVTRDKKVVWSNADHRTFQTISTVQALDVRGDATRGRIVR